MIPVSLRHEDSEVLEANCTITKDYQIISGDESFYRMIGENTMFLMNKLIYPDDLNIFEECIFLIRIILYCLEFIQQKKYSDGF